MGIHIVTEGMAQMENDFKLLSTPVPIEEAKARISEVGKIGFEGVQQSIPVDAGDARRPGGTLRDSARYEIVDSGDVYEFGVFVGTDDDAVPYAKYVLYKNIHKPGGDYMAPMDAIMPLLDDAVNLPFDTVFGHD